MVTTVASPSAWHWPAALTVSLFVNLLLVWQFAVYPIPQMQSAQSTLNLRLHSMPSAQQTATVLPTSIPVTTAATVPAPAQKPNRLVNNVQQKPKSVIPKKIHTVYKKNIQAARVEPIPTNDSTAAVPGSHSLDSHNSQRIAMEQVSEISSNSITSFSPALHKDHSHTIQIHNARYRYREPPVYPRRSRELGQEGTVLLHAEILPNGHTRRLKVIESSGYQLLDHAALSAVKKWEFEPTFANGEWVVSWVQVPVRFVIQP